MARRKSPRIEVEERSRVDRLAVAARYLEAVDPACLDRVLAAAEAFAAILQQRDGDLEPIGVFQARIARINGSVGGGN